MNVFIDSHAHLTDISVLESTGQLLDRAFKAHVKAIINVCVDNPTLIKGLELATKYPQVFNAAARTPHDMGQEDEAFFSFLKQQAIAKTIVAIGETGLDYYYQHAPIDKQKKGLIRHGYLAKEYNLPLIFHCRDAFQDLFALMDQYLPDYPAMVHCFTGNLEELIECLKRGWYISVSGIITFRKSSYLREVISKTPLDRLLLETDTPYLAPQSKRGKVNEPSYIEETAQVLADLKKISLEELSKITTNNSIQFFSLPKQILSV